MSRPFSEYIQIDAVNFSTLKYMRESAKHYLNAVINQRKDSTSLIKLRSIHTAVLEPELLEDLYPIGPDVSRNSNIWKEFVAAHPGKCCMKEDELEETYAVRDAILANQVAAQYLSGGEPELTLVWDDKTTGLKCKGRIDYKHPKARVDLKGAGTDLRVLTTIAARNGYHNQSAWYEDGDRVLFGAELPSLLISYETKEPYDVVVLRYKPEAIEKGREENEELKAKIAQCKKTGKYPGRYEDEQLFGLPQWMEDDENDISDLGLVGMEQVG